MPNKWLWTRSRREDEEKDCSSVETLLPSSTSSIDEERVSKEWASRTRTPSCTSRRWCALNIILFIFSLSILANSLHEKHVGILDIHSLLKKTSYYSPVLDKLEIATFDLQADGALFESDHPSRWRNARKPDPEVEAAWEEFDSIRTFPITADEVRKLGKDPELAVKFPEEYGLGAEAYVAQLDIFHQIHCLNLLRHLASAEYDRDPEHGKHPFSIFTGFTCRIAQTYFDAIVEWQEEHALPLMMGRNITRPVEAKQIPAPDAYYEMFPEENVSIHDRR
ncbi:uncharacterized protein LY89DRAFT_711424 [Mollisia scopiformis]|uniref:Uncharacterized protein n=1 Tax=Mollisia scopiformis TaxID=149040 RepID=A0A132B8J9_MOLSC|nr:uncharacterized protein LY89DRAFT_711424 [Mollisia scopiformis]KUJ08740.1 hypothetical protein LY89DRAFT_711424 [Mollisia scopiformis]